MCMLMHTCCLTPEEHFAYFQLENTFFLLLLFYFFSLAFQVLFVFFVLLPCCFEKNGREKKECYSCDWVRSGLEKVRAAQSVTSRLTLTH